MTLLLDETNEAGLPQSPAFISALVGKTLAHVNGGKTRLLSRPVDQNVAELADAFKDDDPDMSRQMVANLMHEGLDPAQFIDGYACDMARLLGEQWYTNQISFVDVTIAVSRLQATVHKMSASRRATHDTPNAPEVLLIIPKGEDHTIGGFVARDMFERQGCAVHLSIAQETDELVNLAQTKAIDMVGISVAGARSIENAGRLIEALRRIARAHLPIVAGGWISEAERHKLDMMSVDYVTNDPVKALELSGLSARLRKDL